MQARTRIIGVALIIPAALGIGLSATVPAFAAPDCAPGTHAEMSGTTVSCVPDQAAPDASSPAPVPTPAPTSEAPKPSPVPTASSPAPTTPPQPVVTPVPTQTIYVTAPAAPQEPSSEVAPAEPVAPAAPGPAPVQQSPDRTLGSSIPASPQSPARGTAAPSESPKTDAVQQASSNDSSRKAWALVTAAALLALAVAIIVYSVKRFGSPFKRQS